MTKALLSNLKKLYLASIRTDESSLTNCHKNCQGECDSKS